MTLTSSFRILLVGAIAASVTGCSYLAKAILAPQKDISKFYLITPTADTAAPAQGTAQTTSGNFTIGLGPIKLPPYLDRPEIVTRAAPNRLELSKEDRWGESIQNGFTRAMERNLAAQSSAAVIVFPWYNTVHIDMQVQIDVYRFETDAQGTATLSAKWTILDSTGKNVLYTVESNLTQPSKPGDHTEGAAALSRTIGDLSSQIANMLQQLRSHQGTRPA
ncbi:MAG TPA: PqiC family protein [Candidatus Limnocylindrales bacterium]|nr:PqiC family protein [Candidatus Limnocylindrales bacterium]